MKFNNNKTLAESVVMRGLDLAESRKWKDYTVAIREGYREKNKKSIPDNVIATTATLLENTYQYAARMDETTRAVNLGTFIDYGFDVISATIPNLIAHDIVSVQPMNAKHGAIFYMKYMYGNNKGTIQQGSDMNSPFTGIDGAHNFSNDVIDGESIGTGDASTKTFSTSLAYTPIRPGITVIYVGATAVAKADGNPINGVEGLVAIDGSGYTGTVDLNTGAITVTTSGTAPEMDATVTAQYRYNMDLTTVGFSQVDIDLASVSLEAFPRKLRARWLLDAGFELQKMKGIDAESELVTAMSNEIKFEIDAELLKELYAKAAWTGFTWDCQNPHTSLSYQEYKRTIIDLFTEMSNKIFTGTKRVGANFIVAGVNVCNIIETLEEFKADSLGTKQINGPHKIGVLSNKWTVYKNPFYNEDQFVLGYKGSSWLDAGFVYAPYMPLYATPTQVLDDFIFRKGLATSYGQIMLNNKLYAKGSIKNFSSTRMVNDAVVITPAAGATFPQS